MSEDMTMAWNGLMSAKEAYRAEAHRLGNELATLKILATRAVQDYPVASGIYVDMDGQDGYGSLKALRRFLGIPSERTGADVGPAGDRS